MREHWKALTAAAVVILVIIAAVVILNRPAPAAKSDAPPLAATGKFGFPVSTIRIGEGGSSKASDGKTITGYTGTCDSAAQAAANYAPLLIDLNVNTWEQQKQALKDVSKAGPWLETQTGPGDVLVASKDKISGAFDGGWYYRSDVPAGGMHRVASCTERKSAVVQVFTGGVAAVVDAAPAAFFQTVTVELAWDGDWKAINSAVVQEGDNFGGKVKDGGPMSVGTNIDAEKTPVLRDELVNSFFKGKSRDGWVEYANAKR